jgi:hypothetical protein
VIDGVLTLEGLRRRRPEILRIARKRKAHRVAVYHIRAEAVEL